MPVVLYNGCKMLVEVVQQQSINSTSVPTQCLKTATAPVWFAFWLAKIQVKLNSRKNSIKMHNINITQWHACINVHRSYQWITELRFYPTWYEISGKWLSVWREVQTCICPSWCHCHSLSLASVKSRLVLSFWYRLTRVLPEKGR